MFTSAVFGYRIADSLIIVVSIIRLGEVVRLLRLLNVLLGLSIAVLPWFLGEVNIGLNLSATLSGLLAAGLPIPREPKTEAYGMWDKWVK